MYHAVQRTTDGIWRRMGDPRDPGGHTDSFTTSLALYRHPGRVHIDRIPGLSKEPDWLDPDLDFSKYSTSGVIGDARYASAELGSLLWAACVEAMVSLLGEVVVHPDRVVIEPVNKWAHEETSGTRIQVQTHSGSGESGDLD